MPGRPKRAAVLAELERLACESEAESPLDFVCLELESGRTLFDLCDRLSLVVGSRVYAGMVQRLLAEEAGSFEAVNARLTEARKRGAKLLAEQAMSIADDADPTPGSVAKSRAQGDARFRLAEAYDRGTFGSKAAPGVVVNWGALHLDALKAANAAARATFIAPPARPAVDQQMLEAEIESSINA